MRILVTQEDIDNSRRRIIENLALGRRFWRCNDCPVAVALERITGKMVWVGPTRFTFEARDGYGHLKKDTGYFFPHDVIQKIYKFDTDDEMSPFEFETDYEMPGESQEAAILES